MSLVWGTAEQADELNQALIRFVDAARDTRFWHAAKALWTREHPGAEPDHSAIAQLADRLRQE
jgi:hypothetical protein